MKGLIENREGVQTRAAGVVLVAFCLFTIDSGSNEPMHRLWLPLLMAAGAALALRNVLAVALAVLALAGIRADLNGGDWVVSTAYPAVTVAAALVAGTLLVQRFRAYVQETRAARNARRE